MTTQPRLAALCALSSLIGACAPPDPDPPEGQDASGVVETGHIGGSILFENAPGAVATFMASQTVAFPAEARVTAVHTSDPTVSAAGVYAPAATGGASASYALAVPLGTPGTSAFRIAVDTLDFEPNPTSPLGWLPVGAPEDDEELQQLSGPRYRFGSLVPGATTSHVATLTGGSAEYDVAECAALVNVRIRLVGDDADLDALDASPGSIVCSIRALLEDVAFSGDFHPQAHSDLVVSELSVARGQGVLVPILVRGDGSRIRLEVGCAASTVGPGFPLPPELPDGWTLMGTEALDLATDPVECDEVREVDVEILVERTAGVVRGLFDVVGADESHQGVRITTAAGYELVPPTAIASEVLDDGVPTDYWEFEGVPAGLHAFRAWAVIDNGAATLETPHTEQQNGLVDVQPGVTTDLRARFVADPHWVSGLIEIEDPAASDMDFRLLQNTPFNSMSRYLHSHVQARGLNALSTLPGGASGVHGRARGLLEGTFDEATRTAALEYAIPLTGLGPVGGALDGTDAYPTPWSVDRVLLYLRGPWPSDPSQTVFQRVDIQPGYNLVYDAQPGHADELPTMSMCFGHLGLELHLAPGSGTLYQPRLKIHDSVLSGTTENQPPAYSRVTYGEATGVPSESAQAATVGWVEAVLPEGIQYAVQPSIEFVSPDGNESELTFPELSLPLGGPLKCGEEIWDCASVDEDGALHTLGVSIVPSTLCEIDTSMTVVVASDLAVTSIVVEFFDPSLDAWVGQQTVCSGSCGLSPIELVAVDLSGGIESVRVRVEDEFGCKASHVVGVDSYTPVIDCPPEIRVVLEPGELSIASSDPRIQPPLATVGLTSGCGATPPVSHDAPPDFEIGTTTVTFVAEGAEPCQTAVLVAPPVQLAYIEGSDVKVHRIIDGLQYTRNFLEPAAIDFDGEGEYLVVVTTIAGRAPAIVDPETGIDYAELLGFPGFDGPFPSYIHMDARSQGALGFAVSLLGATQVLGSGLAGQVSNAGPTLVDFSDDGERVLVVAFQGFSTDDLVDAPGGGQVEFSGGAMTMGVHVADVDAIPLAFTEIGEIALPASSPIDLAMRDTADGGFRFLVATTRGLFYYDEQLVQTSAVGLWVYSLKLPKLGSAGAVVSWDDGTVGLLTDGGPMLLPEPQGHYDVAFSPQHQMVAVVRPSEIAVYRWEVNTAEMSLDYTLLETIAADGAKYPVFRPGSH